MRRIILAVVVMGVGPAGAKDFPVNDQEQVAISQICEIAARSPTTPIETNSVVSQWCVKWRERMQQASAPVMPSTPPVMPPVVPPAPTADAAKK